MKEPEYQNKLNDKKKLIRKISTLIDKKSENNKNNFMEFG